MPEYVAYRSNGAHRSALRGRRNRRWSGIRDQRLSMASFCDTAESQRKQMRLHSETERSPLERWPGRTERRSVYRMRGTRVHSLSVALPHFRTECGNQPLMNNMNSLLDTVA